jgi:flagellar hook-length control protein FliK
MITTDPNTVNPQQAETPQQRQEKKDTQRSSDRFANMLDSQKKQERQSDKVVANAEKEQASQRQERASTGPSHAANDVVDGTSSLPAIHIEAGKTAESAPAAQLQDLQKLAEEFGHQIELHQLGNKTQAVDITFHSKSLPGLKVQIRQTRGQLAIRFLSQSVSTTELLSKHTASLQEALEDKGLRVASITLAGSRYPTSGPGSNHAAT